MRSIRSIVVLLAALAVTFSATAQTKPATSQPAVKLPGYYSGLANKAGLSLDQRKSLAAALAKQKAAKKELAPKIKQLRDQRKAVKDQDSAEAGKLKDEQKKLSEQRKQAETDFHKSVRDMLKDDQVVKWEKARAMYGLMVSFKRLGLSDQQMAKIDDLAQQAAVQLSQADPGRNKASNKIRKTLREDVISKVLTVEQRAKRAAAAEARRDRTKSSE